jgi:lipopolysaccharide transport system permease protein
MQTEQTSASQPVPQHQIVIEPTRGWSSLGLAELWEYRELVFFTIKREIQGAYRQTALGASWLFLRPIVSTIILSLTFGLLVKVPSDGFPYPLFSLAAVLPWGFFSQAVQRSANSLVQNMHIISKVYFPRLVVPLAGVLSGLVDFGASMFVFFIALLLYQMQLRVEMLTIPLFLLVAVIMALAVGLWLATLSVKYRDVNFAVTFLLQALMYLSPVIYPISIVPEPLRFVYQLNPMTGVIQGFRWALLGDLPPDWGTFMLSILIAIAGMVSGAYIFRRTERTIVDLL